MKRIITLTILTIGFNTKMHCEDFSLNGKLWQKDGRSMALGGGMNAMEQPASNSISVNYHLPYHLKELSTRNIKVKGKTRWMNLEGLWSQSGDIVFRENYLSLGAEKSLSGSLLAGAKAGYYHFSQINGEKKFTMLSEVLCKYRPNENLQISLYLFNPTGSGIKKEGSRICLQQSFHVGGSFYPTKKTEWILEFEKSQKEKLIGHLGFEYAAWDSFILRTGLSAKPLRPSWGIGGRLHHVTYGLGGDIHPVLGLSTCFSLYYNW